MYHMAAREKLISISTILFNYVFLLSLSCFFYGMILRHRGKLGINNVGIIDQTSPKVAKLNEEGHRRSGSANNKVHSESIVNDVTESEHRKSSDDVTEGCIVGHERKAKSLTKKVSLSSHGSSMDWENQLITPKTETNKVGNPPSTKLETSLIDIQPLQSDQNLDETEGSSNIEVKAKRTIIKIVSLDKTTLRNDNMNQSEPVVGKIVAEESIAMDNVSTSSIPYHLQIQGASIEEERAMQKREAEINAAVRSLSLKTLFSLMKS